MLPTGQVIPGYYQQVFLVNPIQPQAANGFTQVQQPAMPMAAPVQEKPEV